MIKLFRHMCIRYTVMLNLMFSCGVFPCFGQIHIASQVNKNSVAQNEIIEWSIIVKNGTIDKVKPFDISPFKIVMGPQKKMSSTIINGVTSSQVSITYHIQTDKLGKHNLPPITLVSKGKTYTTEALTIHVKKPPTLTDNFKEVTDDIFIAWEMPNKNIYVGESTLLDLVLYTKVDIAAYTPIRNLDINDFDIFQLEKFADTFSPININGITYYKKVIYRFTVSSQKKGSFTIPSFPIQVSLPNANARSFFFMEYDKKICMSSPINFHVEDLPQPIPEEFSGIVGPLEAMLSMENNNISVYQPIKINLTIKTTSNLTAVFIKDLGLPAHIFEAYDPRIIKDNQSFNNGILQYQKDIEYIYLPKKDTLLTVNLSPLYFDTEQKIYRKIIEKPIELNIQPNVNKEEKDTISFTLNNNLSQQTDEYTVRSGFFGSTMYYTLYVLGLSSLIVFLGYHKWVHYRQGTKDKRLKIPLHIINNEFDGLSKESLSAQEYYSRLSIALQNYIDATLHKDIVESSNTDSDVISSEYDKLKKEYNQIIVRCQSYLYTGHKTIDYTLLDEAKTWVSKVDVFIVQ